MYISTKTLQKATFKPSLQGAYLLQQARVREQSFVVVQFVYVQFVYLLPYIYLLEYKKGLLSTFLCVKQGVSGSPNKLIS